MAELVVREKPYVLHFITPQKNASPFDANMAYDAAYEAVLPYTNVAVDEVTSLVQDAIFSRGTRGVWRTGIFIGGRDMDVAMEMLRKAKKAMFPPFQVSLFADPSGAFTTGAALSAYVHAICRDRLDGTMKGKRVVVFGATGPVGGCSSIMCAKEGAEVSLVAHSSLEKTQKLAEEYSKTYGVKLHVIDGTTDEKKAALLKEAEILLCCAPAGTRVITMEMLKSAKNLKIAADVNAVPPSGIEGLGAMSDAEPIEGAEWVLGLGALAIGSRKYNVQQKMFQLMLGSDNHVALDFMSAYDMARKIL